MPNSARLSSSPITSPEPETRMPMPEEPATPERDLRNRWQPSPPRDGMHSVAQGDSSPTSTTASTGSIPRVFDSRSTLRGVYSSSSINNMNFSAPTRKLVIRSDPSIVTCFDPKDKELYDLWAPKQ